MFRKRVKPTKTVSQITLYGADEAVLASCPAAEFAKQYGLTEIMPALCNADYGSKELIRARLVRTMTCVDGGDRNQFLRGRALRGPLFPAESGAFEAGDMAISCCDGMHGSQSESHFPLGYY